MTAHTHAHLLRMSTGTCARTRLSNKITSTIRIFSGECVYAHVWALVITTLLKVHELVDTMDDAIRALLVMDKGGVL